MGAHCTEVNIKKNDGDHHDNSEECIIVIGNCPDKDRKAILAFHETGNSSGPGGDWSNNANRCGCGIDQICQLRAGDLVLIRNRAHNASYRKTVKIIIYKNQNPQCNCGKLSPGTGLDLFLGKMSESSGTACTVHQTDHGT